MGKVPGKAATELPGEGARECSIEQESVGTSNSPNTTPRHGANK